MVRVLNNIESVSNSVGSTDNIERCLFVLSQKVKLDQFGQVKRQFKE